MTAKDSNTRLLDCSNNCYSFDMSAKNGAIVDQLFTKLSQLKAATVMVSGAGFANFNEYNDEIKAAYMWMLDSMVEEVSVLSYRLMETGNLFKQEPAGDEPC